MVLKRLQASASVSLPIVSMLLKQKTSALASGVLIPDQAIAEMESYCNRNRLVDVGHGCCPDCLKAQYYQVLASYIGKKRALELIKELPGELGHQGYYLDKDELKKID